MLTKNIVDKLALGKIDFHFEEDLLNKKNEYGEIAKALEQMKENIFSIVDEVNDITEKIKNIGRSAKPNCCLHIEWG
jgi:methyl-accepting chemotaxis protein